MKYNYLINKNKKINEKKNSIFSFYFCNSDFSFLYFLINYAILTDYGSIN